MWKFVIGRNDKVDSQFYFMLYSNEGRLIMFSEYFITKELCFRGVQLARRFSADLSNFNLDVCIKSDFFFRLRDSKDKIVCTSLFYINESSMISDIAGIAGNVKLALVEDQYDV